MAAGYPTISSLSSESFFGLQHGASLPDPSRKRFAKRFQAAVA
jgi:hypothetical protein